MATRSAADSSGHVPRNADPIPEEIVVVCAADGAYVRQLAAMLTSLVEHLDPRRALSVGIVDGGIPAADRERISRLVVRANVRLRWLAARLHSLAELPVWGLLPHVVYQRLLLPELVREVAHKAIWLDCDIVVQQDVGRLWDIDLARPGSVQGALLQVSGSDAVEWVWRPERTVAGTLAARYESARLRNLLYPLERRGLELVRRATRGNGRDRP